MDENKNTHWEEFQKALNQEHKKALEGLNIDLYKDISKTAEIVRSSQDRIVLKEIIDSLRERFKYEDLNQVTDIFIYCQAHLSSNEEPFPIPSQLCVSIGKLFSNKNLHYIASKIYSEDQIESGCALSFLGYLAILDKHTSYVLDFIKDNFDGFSPNNKMECVFQLKKTLPDNAVSKQIVEDSRITEYELRFDASTDSLSRPITFQIDKV